MTETASCFLHGEFDAALRRCPECGAGRSSDTTGAAARNSRPTHERAALALIETTAQWYADNPHRLPHEVDHALCVEILDIAQRGLDGGDLPDGAESA